MKILKKLFIFSLFPALLISLASCDFDLSKLFSDNSTEGENKKSEANPTSSGDNETQTEYIPKTDLEELEIVDLKLDYLTDYGYIKLGEDSEHGSDFQSLYRMFYEQCSNFLISSNDFELTDMTIKTINSNNEVIETIEKVVKFDPIQYNDLALFPTRLDYEMAKSVALEFIYDNPLFYFLHQGCGKATNNNKESIFLNGYEEYRLSSARTAMNMSILSVANSFRESQNFDEMSEYNKIKYTNQYIVERIDYAFVGNTQVPEDSYWAHNIEGFTNDSRKKGVCECYAKVFSLLGEIIDIDSIIVTGTGISKTGSGGHAWNYVYVNDKWYGIDCTWNDTTKKLTAPNGDYFLKGSSFVNSHIPYGQSYGNDYRVLMPTLSDSNYPAI